MTRRASPRLGAYAGLSALGLLAALVVGRPELVVLVAPFALLLAVGLALGRRPQVNVDVALERERALEGEEVGGDDRRGRGQTRWSAWRCCSRCRSASRRIGTRTPSRSDWAPASSARSS